jgi:hypothetical protein
MSLFWCNHCLILWMFRFMTNRLTLLEGHVRSWAIRTVARHQVSSFCRWWMVLVIHCNWLIMAIDGKQQRESLQTGQRAKWGRGSVFVAARGCWGNIPQGGQNWSLLAFPFGKSPSKVVAVTWSEMTYWSIIWLSNLAPISTERRQFGYYFSVVYFPDVS